MMKRSNEKRVLNWLARYKGERAIHKHLKTSPFLVFKAVNQFPSNAYLISEFSIGDQFRADFVALAGYSGGFDVDFIELEPVDSPLFNKSGSLAKRLNGAIAQVSEWKAYVDKNRAFVAQQLGRAGRLREILHKEWAGREVTCNAGLPITDPRIALSFSFHIFIGRRGQLSKDDIVRKTSISNTRFVRVRTYDCFVDVAADLDRWQIPLG